MYCPKCGTNNAPQASACQVCGTPLTHANGAVKQVSMPDGNRLRFANSDAYQAPPSRNSGASTMPAPKKSRKKPLLIALGSVGGVIVLCAVLLLVFLPQLERAMLGEIGYYLYRETGTVQTILSSEYIEALLPNTSFSANTTVSADYESKENSQQAQINQVFFNKTKLNAQIDYDKRAQKVGVDLSAVMNKNTVASARIDVADGAVGISLPKLADGQLVYRADSTEPPTLEEITGYSEMQLLGILREISKETEAASGLSEHIVTGREVYNGENCRYTELTLNAEELRDFIVCGLDTVLDNPDAIAVLKNTITTENAYYKQLSDVLQDSADLLDLDDLDFDAEECIDALEEMRDWYADIDVDEDILCTVKIYYSPRGQIVSRCLTVINKDDDESNIFVLDTLFESKKTDILFTSTEQWKYDGEKREDVYTFSLSAEQSDGKLNGTAKFVNKWNDSSETYFTASFSNVDVEKCGGVPLLTGEISGKAADGEYKFSVISAVVDNQNTITGKLTLDVGTTDEASCTLTAETQLSSSADVSDVAVSTRSTMDMDEDSLESIGETIGENISNSVGNELQQIYDTYAYNMYYDDYAY